MYTCASADEMAVKEIRSRYYALHMLTANNTDDGGVRGADEEISALPRHRQVRLHPSRRRRTLGGGDRAARTAPFISVHDISLVYSLRADGARVADIEHSVALKRVRDTWGGRSYKRVWLHVKDFVLENNDGDGVGTNPTLTSPILIVNFINCEPTESRTLKSRSKFGPHIFKFDIIFSYLMELNSDRVFSENLDVDGGGKRKRSADSAYGVYRPPTVQMFLYDVVDDNLCLVCSGQHEFRCPSTYSTSVSMTRVGYRQDTGDEAQHDSSDEGEGDVRNGEGAEERKGHIDEENVGQNESVYRKARDQPIGRLR